MDGFLAVSIVAEVEMGGVTLRVILQPFVRQLCGYDFEAPKILHT